MTCSYLYNQHLLLRLKVLTVLRSVQINFRLDLVFRMKMAPSIYLSIGLAILYAATADAQLSQSFYAKSCPGGVQAVANVVSAAVRSDRRNAAGLLRLHFHDCFVNVRVFCIQRTRTLNQVIFTHSHGQDSRLHQNWRCETSDFDLSSRQYMQSFVTPLSTKASSDAGMWWISAFVFNSWK